MTTETKPTAGAMRAADRIMVEVDAAFDDEAKARFDEVVPVMARIIDRETGVAELVEALNEVVGAWGTRDVFLLAHESNALNNARAALTKATKEAKS